MTGDFHIGNIGRDAVGVGHGATGSISRGGAAPPGLAELQQRLTELQALIERHAAELADSEVARDAAKEAETEAQSGDPRPRRLRMLLSAITDAATGASAVTSAASGIRALVDGLRLG